MHFPYTYFRLQCCYFIILLFSENAQSSCVNIDSRFGINFEWNLEEDQLHFKLTSAQPVSILLAPHKRDGSLSDAVIVLVSCSIF